MRKIASSYWTLVIGLFSILLGLFLIVSHEHLAFWQKMLFGAVTEFGFAFVIAWVVGQTVEITAKREYNDYLQKQEKALSQNILRFLFDVDLTKSIFKVVTDYVLSKPVIKTKQKSEAQLICIEGNDEWLKMQYRFEYTLRNISKNPVDWPLTFHVPKPEGMEIPNVEGIGIQFFQIGGRQIPIENLTLLCDDTVDSVGQIRYRNDIKIQPGEDVDIQIEFTQLKRTNDNDLFQTHITCEQLNLIVRFDHTKFNVYSEPLHPSGYWRSNIIEPQGVLRASLDAPFLPANGYFIWWNKVK